MAVTYKRIPLRYRGFRKPQFSNGVDLEHPHLQGCTHLWLFDELVGRRVKDHVGQVDGEQSFLLNLGTSRYWEGDGYRSTAGTGITSYGWLFAEDWETTGFTLLYVVNVIQYTSGGQLMKIFDHVDGTRMQFLEQVSGKINWAIGQIGDATTGHRAHPMNEDMVLCATVEAGSNFDYKGYINGAIDAEGSSTYGVGLGVGIFEFNNSASKSTIKQVRTYNRCLSEAEVWEYSQNPYAIYDTKGFVYEVGGAPPVTSGHRGLLLSGVGA